MHRHNLEVQNSRTFVEAMQGYYGEVEDRKPFKQLGTTDKGKMTQLGEEKMVVPDLDHAKMGLSSKPVANPCPLTAGEGVVIPRSINGDINIGEKISARNKLRLPLRFNSNSKESDYGMLSELRNTCWTGKGLIVEMGEKGKRRVSWDYNKGGPKSFKWIPWEASKPTMSQSLNPTLAQNGLGSNKSNEACFSGSSIYKMGKPSSMTSPTPLAHSVTSTSVPLDKPESLLPTVVESERQVEPPMLVSCNCSESQL